MTKRKLPPPKTVVVDWMDRALVFRSENDQLVRVRFPEWPYFQLCCAIAMIQKACSDKDGMTCWRGMTQDQFNTLADEIKAPVSYDGCKPIWAYMASGTSASTKYPKTCISVDGEDSKTQTGRAKDLFERVGNSAYAFGKPEELTTGFRRLWKVDFPEPRGDRAYALLRATVSNLLTRGLVGAPAATDQELRQAISERTLHTCEHLDVWGTSYPMATLYQEPLLSYVRGEGAASPQVGDTSVRRGPCQDSAVSRVRGCRTDSYERDSRVRSAAELYDVVAESRSCGSADDTRPARYVVVGEPGSGKSTLLQHLAFRSAASDDEVLAARIHLVDWNAAGGSLGLEEYLAWSFRNVRDPADCAQWRTWLRAGDVLLLLDGLDEINIADLVVARLRDALVDYDRCPTVLTCRTEVLSRYRSLCRDWPVLQLSPLTPEQREQYVRRFHSDPERDSRPSVDALGQAPLASNPLHLATLCFACDGLDARIEQLTRAELFDKAVRKLLERERTKAPYGDRPVPAIDTKRRVLEHLALHAQLRECRRLTPDDLMQSLREAVAACRYDENREDWATAIRDDLLHNTTLLWGDESSGYRFMPPPMQDFLAASALNRAIKETGWDHKKGVDGRSYSVRQIVDCKAWDPAWQNVISLLAGRLNDPSELLQMLSNPGPTATNPKGDDGFRHRLALAARCLAEIEPEQRARCEVLIDRITEEVLSLWREHLRLGTREVVTHLERALPGLAASNGKVYGRPLLAWLARTLRESRTDEQRTALVAIESIGPVAAATGIMGHLVRLLQDDWLREPALRAIRSIAPLRATAVTRQYLLKMLSDRNEDVLAAAAAASGAIMDVDGKMSLLKRLEELLWADSVPRRVQEAVADALASFGEAAASVPAIVARLYSLAGGEDGLSAAWTTLERLMPLAQNSPRMFIELERMLDSEDEEAVRRACCAIAALGDAGGRPAIVHRLAKLLHEEHGGRRCSAMDAIGSIGTQAATKVTLDGLFNALRETGGWEEYHASMNAVITVERLGQAASTPEIIDAVVDLWKRYRHEQPEFFVTYAVSKAALAIPALRERVVTMLSGEDLDRSGLHMIERIDIPAARPEILQQLGSLVRSDDAELRRAAVKTTRILLDRLAGAEWACRAAGSRELRSLAHEEVNSPAARRIRQWTPKVVSALLDALADDDELIRQEAQRALESVRPDAAKTRAKRARLVQLLASENPDVATAAAAAAGRLAAEGGNRKVVDVLCRQLDHEDVRVRAGATSAISRLGRRAARRHVQDALLDVLKRKNEDEGVRRWAGEALAVTCGRNAEMRALKRLASLLRGQNYEAQRGAVEALRHFGKRAAREEVVLGLLDVVRNGDEKAQDAAATTLWRLGPVAAKRGVVICLRTLVEHKDARIGKLATKIAMDLGLAAAIPTTLNRLRCQLRAPAPAARIAAAKLIRRLHKEQRIFEDSEGNWMAMSVQSLAECGGTHVAR